MACVANKSTTVRNAVNPITNVRNSEPAPSWRTILRDETATKSVSIITGLSCQSSSYVIAPSSSDLRCVFSGREQRGNPPALRCPDAQDAHQEPQLLGLAWGESERELEGQMKERGIVTDRYGNGFIYGRLDMPDSCLLEECHPFENCVASPYC